MPEPSKLTIVSYNIGLAAKGLEILTKTFQENRDLKNADIICLQEASFKQKPDAEVIARSLGAEYEYTYAEAQSALGVMQANAIIYNRKKLDLISSEVMRLPQLPTYMYFLYMPMVGKTRFDERNCLIQTFVFKGNKIRVYNTHLDVRGGWKLKEDQLMSILRRVDSSDSTSLDILCGDLNTATIVPEKLSNKRKFMEKLKRHFSGKDFNEVSSNIEWTFNVANMHPKERFYHLYQIIKKLGVNLNLKWKTDFIFTRCKKPFRVVDKAYTLDVDGSDHLPLVFKINYA